MRHSKGPGLRERMEKALLEYHTPACVVIDQKHTILYIHGRTGKYLEPVAGEATSNLVRMAREGLKTELATALHAVITRQGDGAPGRDPGQNKRGLSSHQPDCPAA